MLRNGLGPLKSDNYGLLNFCNPSSDPDHEPRSTELGPLILCKNSGVSAKLDQTTLLGGSVCAV